MTRTYIISFIEELTTQCSDWINHHLSLGVDGLILFASQKVDVSDDLIEHVKVITCDGSLLSDLKKSDSYDQVKSYVDTHHFVLKKLKVEYCLKNMEIHEQDWFMVLNQDEFLEINDEFNNINEFFETVEQYGQCIVNNFEQVVETELNPNGNIYKKGKFCITNYQDELRAEALGYRPYFNSYSFGKAAFRPFVFSQNGYMPKSSFAYVNDNKKTIEANYQDIFILTQPFADIDIFKKKFSDFSEVTELDLIGDNETKSFNDSARKVIKDGIESEILNFFQKNIVWSEEEVEKLEFLKLTF